MRLIDTYAKLRLLAPDGKHAKKLYKQLSLVVLNLFKLTISASFTFFSRLTCSRVQKSVFGTQKILCRRTKLPCSETESPWGFYQLASTIQSPARRIHRIDLLSSIKKKGRTGSLKLDSTAHICKFLSQPAKQFRCPDSINGSLNSYAISSKSKCIASSSSGKPVLRQL